MPESIFAGIRNYLQSLENKISKRLQGFKKIELKFYLLPYPLTADIDKAKFIMKFCSLNLLTCC